MKGIIERIRRLIQPEKLEDKKAKLNKKEDWLKEWAKGLDGRKAMLDEIEEKLKKDEERLKKKEQALNSKDEKLNFREKALDKNQQKLAKERREIERIITEIKALGDKRLNKKLQSLKW